MSVIRLRTFVEVYRQLSFSKAAAALRITQPAVSSHIAGLEAQLNHPLFIRHARGVRATAIADELALKVGKSIDHAEAALARMKAQSIDLAGIVSINGPIDVLSSLLAPRLGALIERGIQIRLHPTDGDNIFHYLGEGHSDFAMCVDTPPDERFDYCELGLERIMLVAAPALAKRLQADLSSGLTTAHAVTYNLERVLVRHWLQHHALSIDLTEAAVTAPDLRCLRELALTGIGWTVLPAHLVSADLRHGRLVEVEGPASDLVVKLHLCWRTGAMRSPRIARLQQAIKALFVAGD